MEGNKEIVFEISEEEVKKRIETNSYYRGERLKSANVGNAVLMQAGSDNYDIIEDELILAERQVEGIISRNLGVCTTERDNGTCQFKTKAASNFPEDLKTGVEGAILNFLHDKTLEGWMLITMPEEVASLRDRFLADAEELRRILLERSKPVR